MKAVVVKEVGVLEVQDVPETEPSPCEIKVKIAYAGICGTDLKILDSTYGDKVHLKGAIVRPEKTTSMRDPITHLEMRDGIRTLGHEASGTIVKIGKDVKGDFKEGQRVAMNFLSPCGSCYYCVNGMADFCERTAPVSGAMAEYSYYRENIVFPLPDEVPLDVGAMLEPTTVALSALENVNIKVGDSVIITGGGTIGLLTLQLAIRLGATKVLFSEPIDEKRKLAKQFGADVVVDPLKEDLLEISNQFTDGRGFNKCIEASGVETVAKQLILLAEYGGHIAYVANYSPDFKLGIPLFYMHMRRLTIHTTISSPYLFPKALKMLSKLDLKPLITVYPLKEASKAFEAHKMGKYVTIMLKP